MQVMLKYTLTCRAKRVEGECDGKVQAVRQRRLDNKDRQEVVGLIALKLERYPQRGARQGWRRLAEAGEVGCYELGYRRATVKIP